MFPIHLLTLDTTPTPAPTPAECPNDGVPKMDGTGAHLGLRNPWWNDDIHTLTDSTLFRWLLIAVVIDHIWSRLK